MPLSKEIKKIYSIKFTVFSIANVVCECLERILLGIFAIEYLAVSSTICPDYADFRCTRALVPPHRLSTFAIRCVSSRVHLLAHEWSPLASGIVHGFW